MKPMPAHLFIGPAAHIHEQAILFLQKQLCTDQGCAQCITCTSLSQLQHEAIQWLCPDKNYVLDDIKKITATLSFSLQKGQLFFFILEKADTLSITCSNALLKSLEEPPQGYHFILLAQRPKVLLPTIQSRCITTTFYEHNNLLQEHPLTPFFTLSPQRPDDFIKTIESCTIDELETVELINSLLNYWHTTYINSITTRDSQQQTTAERYRTFFSKALQKPPMPGSSKLFWRNAHLQLVQKP